MDWPVLCPSFRLSFSFILPPFTLLTLGVPCSSIDNGGAAAPAAGSLDSLIVSASNNLDPQFLVLLHKILSSQSLALSLLALRSQQLVGLMEIHNTSSAPTDHVAIELEGQTIEVRYPAEPQPPNSLIFPGEYTDGVMHTVYKDINNLKREALLALCKQYSLGTLGNKSVLKQKLIGFSENKIRWPSLIHGARRAHRGVRDGGITKNKPKPKDSSVASSTAVKKLKPSVIRQNELLGLPLNAPLGSQLFDTQRSKDTRTLEEKAELLRWAKEFDESHPYIPEAEIARRRKAREEERAKEKAAGTVMVTESIRSMNEQIANLTATINMLVVGLPTLPPLPATVLAQLQTQPSIPPAPFSSATSSVQTNRFSLGQQVHPVTSSHSVCTSLDRQVHPVTPDPIPFLSPPSTTPMTTGALASNSTTATSATPTNGLVIAGATEETTFSLAIGHGQIIRYKYSDIREPRQISFATNIVRLDRVWDDESLNWDPIDCARNLLQINGTAIALRYWQTVFSGKKNRVWSWLKKLWTEWKYVAERYRSRGPDDFWQEFSLTKGEHFHWKAITDPLRELRSAQDERLVDRAKVEYGDRFSQVFVNNRGKVLTDKSAIARRYLAELDRCLV
ncbi:hypothetical protein C8R41DRAFT_865216 [Lentinula lateritia]|uniref:SAP domain-containing protein n=1 Tax=Lentinula lateritia TaxID=40482 RepID=A0ABQ8VMX8_9AGAR|nr:hypothetical protein C8R41DRAFT_865216 [Lentinula lateritia]